MAFIAPVIGSTMSTLARAKAAGCGLFAAHSFQIGEEARGFGAPVAVSGLFFIILIG